MEQQKQIQDYYKALKVYSDGSHYIGIPHTERPKRYRPKQADKPISQSLVNSDVPNETIILEQVTDKPTITDTTQSTPSKTQTLKDVFDELYMKYATLRKKDKAAKISEEMAQHFATADDLQFFIESNFERKKRNAIERNKRMVRKARLANFNFFCTFTFDGKKHTPETLHNLSTRDGWKYMGVWERSNGKERLHFHGLFHIPNDAMVGELIEVKDYSVKSKSVQTTIQNTYFNERFGRSDFEPICPQLLGNTLGYMMKYIDKSGERIVCSKGLYQYFVCDVMGKDVLCLFGVDDRKLLLFDRFNCWDEGVLIGQVSEETIAKLPKSN